MTQQLSITELERMTGIDLTNKNLNDINTNINEAQSELERKTSRTFSATDSDINTVKRAIAFLTEFYIRTTNRENDQAKTALSNYYREVTEFHNDPTPNLRRSTKFRVSVITNEGLSD